VFSEVFLKHAGLVVLLVIFIHLSRWLLTYQAKLVANAWIKRIDLNAPPASEANAARASDDIDTRRRLNEQLLEIKRRAKHHLDITVFFYTRYYMAITLFSILGGTAAIALIFITKSGWSGVSPYVITVFLITSGHAAFYGAFPRIFQQEKNIADNKNLYTQYVALQNELESYFLTGEDINGAWKTGHQFVHYIDQQLARLNNFAIGFDYTKTPNYLETFDDLK
jgi:hypothetical protein